MADAGEYFVCIENDNNEAIKSKMWMTRDYFMQKKLLEDQIWSKAQ